jgi:hypothetical protein
MQSLVSKTFRRNMGKRMGRWIGRLSIILLTALLVSALVDVSYVCAQSTTPGWPAPNGGPGGGGGGGGGGMGTGATANPMVQPRAYPYVNNVPGGLQGTQFTVIPSKPPMGEVSVLNGGATTRAYATKSPMSAGWTEPPRRLRQQQMGVTTGGQTPIVRGWAGGRR